MTTGDRRSDKPSELDWSRMRAYSDAQRADTLALLEGLTHEISNQLAIITSCADEVRELGPAANLRYVEFIENAAQRAREALVRALKHAALMIDDWEPVPLAEWLSAQARALDLRHADALPTLLAERWLLSPSAIGAALAEMVRNAREAMPQVVPALEVGSTPEGFLRLTVVTEGVGISESDLSRAGTPFWSTHRQTEPRGLGLARVRAIAIVHGGELTVAAHGRNLHTTITLSPTPIGADLSGAIVNGG